MLAALCLTDCEQTETIRNPASRPRKTNRNFDWVIRGSESTVMIQFCHEKNGDSFERALSVTVEAFAEDPLSHWIVRQERLVKAFNAYGIRAVFSAAPQGIVSKT